VIAKISIQVRRLRFTLSDASGNTVDLRLETVDVISAIKQGVTVLLNDDPSSIWSQADFTSLTVKKTTSKFYFSFMHKQSKLIFVMIPVV